MKIEKKDNWYIIADEFYFSADWEQNWLYNLNYNIWEDVLYWKQSSEKINYPGEYDIQWNYIKCISWKNWLCYFIKKTSWESFAIVDSVKVFEDDDFCSAEKFIYEEDKIDLPSELEKMELSSECYALK